MKQEENLKSFILDSIKEIYNCLHITKVDISIYKCYKSQNNRTLKDEIIFNTGFAVTYILNTVTNITKITAIGVIFIIVLFIALPILLLMRLISNSICKLEDNIYIVLYNRLIKMTKK